MSLTRLSSRTAQLASDAIVEVFDRSRAETAAGRSLIRFDAGEPDFPTPANIVAAAVRALAAGYTHYTPPGGLADVREAVAGWVGRRRRLDLDASQVMVTPGSTSFIMLALLALLEDGDEVIVPEPAWPVYETLVRLAGGSVVRLPLRAANGYRIDPEELSRLLSGRTRLLVLTSPHNPTGSVHARPDLERIAELALAHGFDLLSDEIYELLTFEGDHSSPLALAGLSPHTIYSGGLSKGFSMCGWRLGFGVAPPALIARMESLTMNTTVCAPAFVQVAAIEALESAESARAVGQLRDEMRRRRDLMVSGLRQLPGVSCQPPGGAFYAFPNIQGTGRSDHALVLELLQRGLAAVPGSAFGAAGSGHLRLSFGIAPEQIAAGLQVMRDVLGTG